MATIDNKKAIVVFFDLEKACELASVAAVADKAIKGNLLAWAKGYMQDRQARVTFQGATSKFLNLENGTPHGGILSPFLFNILMEELANSNLPNGVEIFIYANDVCLEACTTQQLKQAAQEAIQLTTATNTYFTDGSVDLSVPAAAAGVYSTTLKGSWRLSDNASTLQTELIAIAKALEDSQHRLGNTTIHNDSKGAIQAITKGKVKENIKLLTRIWALAKLHQNRNRQITLKWIPSHVGIQGNEEADSLAKSRLHINNVNIKINHSLNQLKSIVAAYCQTQEESRIRRAIFRGSKTAKCSILVMWNGLLPAPLYTFQVFYYD
ncbi:uncharacterized protein LOC135202837 [Macrobrachium nipponense]|uniref:uncharacterized protein LOC135202837 n=1 Tax=Macrobrachium nipponense TaxID=159736 RepID=UPI0030C7C13C